MTELKLVWTEAADTNIALPAYATDGAAGADIRANFPLDARDTLTIPPGAQVAVPTGLRMEIPQGYEVQIRPRSGLARKYFLTILNAPATIDSDYRGEVMVLLFNAGSAPATIEHGDRIAQVIVAPVERASFVVVAELGETERGKGGFGSTGTS